MSPLNFYDAPMFPVRDGAKMAFLTLEQAIRSQLPGQITHPMGYLAAPTRMLAHAMTQWLATQLPGGAPSESDWRAAVVDGRPEALADKLFTAEALVKAKAGFDLMGESAFMQLPASLFKDAPSEPIEGLFQPFRGRKEGTAKALRAESSGIRAICPHCAAVGLLSTHLFSGSMAQYWGSAPTRGACVHGLSLPTVSRSLVANILHAGDPLLREELQPLPWVPASNGHAGFERDGRMPFERHLFPGTQMSHPANVGLPLIRALRLKVTGPGTVAHGHDALGTCDACGRTDQALIRSFYLLPEPAIHASVADATRQAWSKAHNGASLDKSKILSRTLQEGAIHPALAYVTPKKKGADEESMGPMPQRVFSGVDTFKESRPAWVQMTNVLDKSVRMPAVFQQILNHSIEGLSTIGSSTVFGVRFEGATNPNPKFVLDASLGIGHLLHPAALTNDLGAVCGEVIAAVELAMDAWVGAGQTLDHDVNDADRGFWVREAPGSDQRRAQARAGVLMDPVLWSESNALWDVALQQIHRMATHFVKASIDQDPADQEAAVDALKQDALDHIARAGRKGWLRFLASRGDSNPTMPQLFLETKADEDHRRLMFPKKPKAVAVATR